MRNLVIKVLFLFLLISGVSKADGQLARPDATISQSVLDFIFLEKLAPVKVAPETEAFVCSIQKELGLEKKHIRILSMSNLAQRHFGRMNAFVTYFNSLVISEKWFKSLPDNQKRALIGHELMHIKKRHILKKFCFDRLIGLMIRSLTSKCLGEDNGIALPTFILLYLYLIFWYSRHTEREADMASAKELNCAALSCDLFKYFKEETTDPESRFAIKRILSKIRNTLLYPLEKFFATHPSLDERINYLNKLAQQQEKALVVN